MTTEILDLVLPSEYRTQRQLIFPSTGSLDWFIRRHRNALVEIGAMLMPTGRWLVNPPVFDRYLLMIGVTQAQTHAR